MVIGPDAGVVPADDDVGAAEILADDGMVDGFRGRRSASPSGGCHDGPFLEVIMLDQLIVGGQDDLVLENRLSSSADDRVDEKCVGEG